MKTLMVIAIALALAACVDDSVVTANNPACVLGCTSDNYANVTLNDSATHSVSPDSGGYVGEPLSAITTGD